MSQIRFGVGDVAEIRFCVSPLWETVASLWALHDPGRHAVHLPWIGRVRSLTRRPDVAAHLAVLDDLTRPRAWLPDFLTPPPSGPLVEIDGEIARIRATPPDVVVRDMLATTRKLPLTAFGQAVVDDPVGTLPRIADAVQAWHEVAIAPYWPRMRALLEADIAYRARQLAEGGARLLFDNLHPSVRWGGDRIVSDDPWEVYIDVRGRGLALSPSVFVDRRVLWSVLDSSPPGATYPARAVGTLWESRPAGGGKALAAVVGSARAALLMLLQTPATTTDLARRTGLSPGAVSQHLAALCAAGLTSRSRQGRSVFYLGTPAADELLRASGSTAPEGSTASLPGVGPGPVVTQPGPTLAG